MDVTALTVWVAVLAVATVVQVLLLIGGAIVAFRKVQRVEARMDTVVGEIRAEMRPIMAQLDGALRDVRDVASRARRIDAQLTAAAGTAARGLEHAKTAMLMRMWPAVGLVRAGAAAFRALRRSAAPRESRQDALALARFVNEGGPHG